MRKLLMVKKMMSNQYRRVKLMVMVMITVITS